MIAPGANPKRALLLSVPAALTAVQERAQGLLRDGAWEAEVRARRASVSAWDEAANEARSLDRALPIAVQRFFRGDAREEVDARVGLARDGRPVILERTLDGYVKSVWQYLPERTEKIRFQGGTTHVTWVLHPGTGPAKHAVGANDGCWIEAWHWEAGFLVRVDRAEAAARGWSSASAAVAGYDDRGEIEQVKAALTPGRYEEDNRLAPEEVLPALEAALERAARLGCTDIAWESRLARPERLRDELAGMGCDVARGLADAITTAARAQPVERPFCATVELRSRDSDAGPVLPPRVLVASEVWLERVRESHPFDGECYRNLWEGLESGAVVDLDLSPHCDDATLRGCRELSTAISRHGLEPDSRRARRVVDELGDLLAELLSERSRWPDATEDFLALVTVTGKRHEAQLESLALARAKRAAGSDRVEAFLEAATSTLSARSVDPERAAAALHSRSELEVLLSAVGLNADAHRLAHEIAEYGVLARKSGASGSARSRLGGRGLLPSDTDWPCAAGERPLSFLAGLDLAELPPSQTKATWPADGWLLFFADIGDAFGDLVANVQGSPARTFYLPSDVDPVAATAPLAEGQDPPPSLTERRIAFESILTLPAHEGAAATVGAHPDVHVRYEGASEVLWRALDRYAPGPRHWVRGHVCGVQGHPPEQDTVLLLHLDNDLALDFDFLDGGTIQFRIPVDALAVEDWSAITAEPDSH